MVAVDRARPLAARAIALSGLQLHARRRVDPDQHTCLTASAARGRRNTPPREIPGSPGAVRLRTDEQGFGPGPGVGGLIRMGSRLPPGHPRTDAIAEAFGGREGTRYERRTLIALWTHGTSREPRLRRSRSGRAKRRGKPTPRPTMPRPL